MPLYEYQCADCDHQVELLIRGSDEPVCPDCGGRRLTRLLSVVAASASRTSGSDSPPEGPCGASCACFPQS